MESEFKTLRLNLDVFLTLEKGDKLMKGEDGLYSSPAGAFQSFKRWLNSESKEKTLEYLNQYFQNFINFLKKVGHAVEDGNLNILFLKKVREYINSILPGLFSLKETYPTYLELHCKISSIVRTLFDFKTGSIKYITTDYKFHQF